jgi:hypothetical protein
LIASSPVNHGSRITSTDFCNKIGQLETSRPIYFLPVAVPPPVQSELIGWVSYNARALCVAAAKHVVANKQTLDPAA